MAWRLHLANQAVQSVDILSGESQSLAVWLRQDRLAFYDLATGTHLGEKTLKIPNTEQRTSDKWQAFLATLTDPNGAYLPCVRLDEISIHLTDDGRMRLYDLNHGEMALDSEGEEVALDTQGASAFVAVALDRFLGLSVALDRDGKLFIYQQQIRVGVYDLGLSVDDGLRGQVAITRGGGSIYVSNGQTLILTDTSGKVQKRLDTHYLIRQMCCSPDGRYVMTNDLDNGVIRVYDGPTLTPTHQRFAIDLVAEATQVQLMADLPPSFVAPTTLDCDDLGRVAFAMSGVICVSDLSHMDELPRPRTLL